MRKEFKGTKGEWRVGGSDDTTVLSDIEYNGMVADVVAPDKHCPDIAYCSDGTHWEENLKTSQANAKLIAAAPDLLEALLSLMGGVANLPPFVAIDGVLKTEWVQGLKAINKALGL